MSDTDCLNRDVRQSETRKDSFRNPYMDKTMGTNMGNGMEDRDR